MELDVLTGFEFFSSSGMVRSALLIQPHTYTMSFTTLHCDSGSSAGTVNEKQLVQS